MADPATQPRSAPARVPREQPGDLCEDARLVLRPDEFVPESLFLNPDLSM
jgi:hypothetical protein